MNFWFSAAAIFSGLLCIAHSILGEKKIFSGWRRNDPNLSDFMQGIIWATWHVVSVLGIVLTLVLALLANNLFNPPIVYYLQTTLVISFVVCALLVITGTKWRHPAWVVFLTMAVCTMLG